MTCTQKQTHLLHAVTCVAAQQQSHRCASTALAGLLFAALQVEEVVQPVPDNVAAQFMLKRDGCTGEAFVAVYKSIKQATAAVAKLHGQTASAAQQAAGKKGKKAAAAPAAAGCRVWARQLSGEGLHQKRWRLIVRNLPFTVSGQLQQGAQQRADDGGVHCLPAASQQACLCLIMPGLARGRPF